MAKYAQHVSSEIAAILANLSALTRYADLETGRVAATEVTAAAPAPCSTFTFRRDVRSM
jgi:hypothetical protein